MNGDQKQDQDQAPARPGAGGVSWARSADYPNGSTSRLRGDVLAALGVLKVATADQLQRITRPGLKSNKSIRAALLDLGLHALVTSDGRTAGRDKLWRLTLAGLDAAAEVLPGRGDLGGTARGAGRTGAPHSMMVNETVAAALTGGTAPGAAPGTGTITDWSTETVHDIGPRLRAITDAVLRAPQEGVPVLLVEVDRGTMTPAAVAAKFERYDRYFRREAKQGGESVPHWQLLYGRPPRGPHREDAYAPHPPVALVFGGNLGPVALTNRIAAVEELSTQYWRPTRYRGGSAWTDNPDPYFSNYGNKIPIIATTLDRLREHGLTGPCWHRFGHPGFTTLHQALADPDGYEAYQERERQCHQARRDAENAAQEAEQEAHRCPTCHRRPDQYDDLDDPSDGTTDCGPCQQTALKAAGDAERAHNQRDAEARERCATCTTGLIENSLLDHDPDTIECWTCHQNRTFRGDPPLRRPEPKKKRWFNAG
ncbi:replication-relaxation family protein [Kitasatospora sp. NPDC058406]|uniref:replication-relaxation family protein n=1 Tax=Kitasatospora sp. NPDC058406 TaxID=3346483 RepID=UPI00366908E2